MSEDGESDEPVAKDSTAPGNSTHSRQKLVKEQSKPNRERRKLVSDLVRREKTRTLPKRKKNQKGKTPNRNPSVDTTRAKSSGDVLNLAIRELNWREVNLFYNILENIFFFLSKKDVFRAFLHNPDRA